MSSTETPALSGRPGPGEITIPAGARPSSSATGAASLRTTSVRAPSDRITWTRLKVKES